MANKKDTAMAKHSLVRTWFQAAWFALTNGYARGYTSGKIFTGNSKALCVPGLNCYSCPGALASCPIGSLQAVFNKGTFKISLYVFGLLTTFGVLFGRLVCGWMCPFGLVQDLLHKIPLGPKKKNLPGHKYLRWLRFVVLAVMVVLLPLVVVNAAGVGQPWFCEWICPSGTLLGGIPLTIVNEEFRKIIGFRFFWKVGLLVLFCLGAIWYYRPFCKYLCPLGAIYGVFNPVSTYRLEIDAAKCVKCRACQKACGMDIATFETPNSMDCIRCGDCMKACPTGAISSTWGKTLQNVKTRCFVDDDAVAKAIDSERQQATAAVQPTETAVATTTRGIPLVAMRVISIVMIVGGFVGAATSAFFSLYADFDYRINIEDFASVGPGSLILGCCKVAASLIIALTGIYLLRNARDGGKIFGACEKTRTAFIVYVAGVVAALLNTVINLNNLSLLMGGIYACYPLAVTPCAWGLFASAKRYLTSGKRKILMWIFFALTIVLSAVTCFMGGSIIIPYLIRTMSQG